MPDYSACALVGLRPGSFSLRASLLTILLLAPSLASTLAANRLLAREDTRVLAATWMARHAPAGSGVLMLGTHYSLPALRPTRDTVLASMQKAKGLRQEERTTPGASCYAERLANVLIESSPAERLVVADSGKNKPLVCSPPPAYRLFRLGDRGPELARRLAISRSDDLLAAGIDFVVITEHPFDRAPLPQPVLDALRRAGTTCYEVAPGRPDGAQGPIYDPIDAFFLPYAGFEGVERPGPTIRIVSLHSAFRRSCR